MPALAVAACLDMPDPGEVAYLVRVFVVAAAGRHLPVLHKGHLSEKHSQVLQVVYMLGRRVEGRKAQILLLERVEVCRVRTLLVKMIVVAQMLGFLIGENLPLNRTRREPSG